MWFIILMESFHNEFYLNPYLKKDEISLAILFSVKKTKTRFHGKIMEQFNQKLLEMMLGNDLVSELSYRFPLLLSWLTWVAASIVCLLVALVACLKWFLLSEWEIKETFSTMVFQGYLYYTSLLQRLTIRFWKIML